jgi:hypothetical protein
MTVLIYSVATFHLFPLVVFLILRKRLKGNVIFYFILALVISSFLSDLIGLWFSSLGFNTNPVSNAYQITERLLATLIVVSVSAFSNISNKIILAVSGIISICQVLYGIPDNFLIQNDYIKLLSGIFICLLSLYAQFILLSNLTVNGARIDIKVWPVFAIFFYASSMLIPQMITNIDDSVEFPNFFQHTRLGVAIGSNIIRDSLFAFFFFQAKKMNYDTGK